jgi:hypothetical protein
MTQSLKTRGRHRARRARLTLAQRLGAAAVLLGGTGFAAAVWPTSAVADAPVQTAWYNAVSGGGQAAPDPLTPAGGLHVSVASGEVLAFAAVQYTLAEGSTATIEFKISNLTATPVINPTAPTTDPAAYIVACPISGTWKAGDDQPMDAAPKYDCTRSVPGNLSADSTTLTFLADSSIEAVPGQLSLAIVPVTTDNIPGVGTPAPADTTQPFSLDINKPDASSLTVTGTSALPAPAGAPKPATGGTTAGSGSTAGAGSAAGGSSAGVSLPGAMTTDSSSTSSDAGTSPVVAPSQAPAAAPAAATVPSTSNRAHNAALAMLLLIGIGLVAMSSGQMQRAPRLLGGAGRHAAMTTAATAATTAAAAVPMGLYGNRGLGRFNKPRTEPARPLT